MKTQEELNALKEEVEVEAESKEPRKLTEEELEQVTGGGKKADIISIATGMIIEVKTGVDEFVERR